MHYSYSWDLDDIFYEYVTDLDLSKGFQLVYICFEQFPKEQDSITHIVLEGVLESCKDEKSKIMCRALIEYLNHLLKNNEP